MSKPKFRFLDVEAVQKGKVGHNPHRLYIAHDGVSYAGKCNNSSCSHYQQMVSYKRGKDNEIQPFKDYKVRKIVKCPSCNEGFVIEEVILFNCDCTIEYILFDDPDDNLKTKRHSPKGKDYVKLGKDSDGIAIWKYYSFLELNCK